MREKEGVVFLYTVIHQKLLFALSTNELIKEIAIKTEDNETIDIHFNTLIGSNGLPILLNGFIKIMPLNGNLYTVITSVGFSTESDYVLMVDSERLIYTDVTTVDANNANQSVNTIKGYITDSIRTGIRALNSEGYILKFPPCKKQKGFTKGLEKLAQGLGVAWNDVSIKKREIIELSIGVSSTPVIVKLTKEGVLFTDKESKELVGSVLYADYPTMPIITSLEELVFALPDMLDMFTNEYV